MSEDSQAKVTTNFAKTIMFVFAIFGFFGSIATIYDVFSKPQSHLVARAYPSSPKIPYFLYSQIGPGFEENGRTFVDILDERCKNSSDNGKQEKEQSEDSLHHYCRHTKDLKNLSARMEDAFALRGTVFDIDLENRGGTKATNIKIPANAVEFIDVYSKGRRVNISYDQNKGDYSIPDLNPGESYNIQIWQSGIPFTESVDHFYGKFDISFDGPPVNIDMYKYVDETQWEFVEIFFDFGPVFGTILFLFVGFAGGLAIVALVSLLVGLSQGKTVKEIFATPEKEA